MLGKLVKFIILSRVSKGGLILLSIFSVAGVLIDFSLYEAEAYGHLHLYPLSYSLGYMTAFYALIALFGGMSAMRPDLDYLFTLPVDRKLLSLALFISNTILMSFLMTFLTTFSFNAYLFFVSPLLGVSLVSLNVMLREVRALHKALIVTLIALWFLSPIWGFPFSPTSAALGYLPNSLAVTAVYTAILTYLALKRLENYDLIVVRSLTANPEVVEQTVTFGPSTPLRAFIKLRLAYLSFSGRMRYAGVHAGRLIRPAGMMPALSASALLAVIYYIIFKTLSASNVNSVESGISIAVVSTTGIGSILGVSNLTTERAWLTVPYLGPKFIRYLSLGAWVQTITLFLPIAIANLALSIYNPLFLYAGLIILVDVPVISAFSVYLQAVILPIQLKDELTLLNSELRVRNSISSFFSLALYILEMFVVQWQSLTLVLGMGLGMALLLVLLTRDELARKVINQMTEMGYV